MIMRSDDRGGASSLLGAHSWLRSDCFEETSCFLRKEKGLSLAQAERKSPNAGGFSFELNWAALPRTHLYFVESHGVLEQARLPGPAFDFAVQVPLEGWIGLRMGDRAIRCEPGCAAMVSPTDDLRLTTSDGCRRLVLRVSAEALTTHLAWMLGDRPDQGLAFSPDSASSDAFGRRIANAVCYFARELECVDAVRGQAVLVAQFEQFVISLFLLAKPNNYSEVLGKRETTLRPKDVKRAIDYIHANLGEPISLVELSEIADVPGRTLCQHFRDFTGISPMRYVRNARFERVRDELSRLHGEGTVTEVARRWGFTHMGRFSAEYRARFGELPAVTAQRRKPSGT